MEKTVQSVKFDADRRLLSFVDEKISKLERFSDHIVAVDTTLKIDKDHEHGNKVAVVKVKLTGDELLAERRSKTFEESIDLCVDALRKQMEKYRAKAVI